MSAFATLVLFTALVILQGAGSEYVQVGAHGLEVVAKINENVAAFAVPVKTAKDPSPATKDVAVPTPAVAAKDGKPAPGTAFGSFVKKMDVLLAKLKREQQSDDEKKVYCETELSEVSVAHVHEAIDAAKGGLVKLVPRHGAALLTKVTQGKTISQITDPLATERMKVILKFVDTLHAECDWLLANYAVRKEARKVDQRQLRSGKMVLKRSSKSIAFKT